MKCKERGKHGEVVLKIDISKAYEHVDWRFLKEIMLKMGFDAKWVKWVMLCVCTVQYYVLINNELLETIILGRCLQQSNPLSPFLYILCVEGLSSLVKNVWLQSCFVGETRLEACHNPYTLVARIFKARYGRYEPWLRSVDGVHSFTVAICNKAS